MKDPLPIATVTGAVFDFLRGRTDAVVFGAHAVNAYAQVTRMTEDVDIMALNGAEFAEELRGHLAARFRIAVRIREVRGGIGFRLYQVRKPENRHLVDVRPVEKLPPALCIQDILFLDPVEVIAAKLIAWNARKSKPKGGSDWRDLASMALAFPDLKTSDGPVLECLKSRDASPTVMTAWQEFVKQEISIEEDDEEFQ